MGRTVAFAARSPLGANKVIAADESTALIVNQAGVGKTYGAGSIYFVEYVSQMADTVMPGSPLSIGNVKILRQPVSDATFDVKNWQIPTPTKTISVVNGVINMDPY